MSDHHSTSGHPLQLPDGEQGRALDYTDGVLHIVCERAHPPGEPLALTLRPDEGAELGLQGKCVGSKRREDGGFDVRLKLVSLRREQRAALEELFG